MRLRCSHEGCERPAEMGKDECFYHRISGVSFRFRGGGGVSKHAFHERTNQEWMREHLGTTDDRELGRQGIERRV